MADSAEIRSAAENVIRMSLRARPNDHILLVFDAFGREIADGFLEAALVLNQRLTAVYVPVRKQEVTSSFTGWRALTELVKASKALVVSLTDGHASTGFRSLLLDTAMQHGLKAVHMPGVTDDDFITSVLGVDFKHLHRHTRRVAVALTTAREAKIHTVSRRNNETHCLSLRLEGRSAHADGGIVKPGEIINIPTGEAYIAAIEESAEGSIIINGSFPECKMPHNQEVMLTFRNGYLDLDACRFPNCGAGVFCKNLLLTVQDGRQSDMQLGELGIGLNRGVASVEGRTILDEKVFGTSHIAIGSNKPFGGKNSAPYHIDMVFYPHSILLDGAELDIQWKAK